MHSTKTLSIGILPCATFICLAQVLYPAHCLSQSAIELEFFDKDSGEHVSARMTFTKSSRKIARPRKILFASEQWLAEKRFQLTPPNGEFEFLAQRGPEFSDVRGGFTIEPRAKDNVSVEIPRSIDMHSEHWYSGDHLSSLPQNELSRWQSADAVDLVVSAVAGSKKKSIELKTPFAPVRSKSAIRKNKESELVDEDKPTVPLAELAGLGLSTRCRSLEWSNGAVLIHYADPAGGGQSVPINGQESKFTSQDQSELNALADGVEALQLLGQVFRDNQDPLRPSRDRDHRNESNVRNAVVAELVRPWSRDVPLLLSSQAIRSVQILSSYNRPVGDDRLIVSKESIGNSWGKVIITQGKDKLSSEVFAPINAQEKIRFQDTRGVGKLSEYIYWQMLEAGLRIAPTAGSGFNGNDTHVGYNRVYVHSVTPPSEASWWEAIGQGRTCVTNGPLLRATINGLPPGSVHASYRRQPILLDIAVSLAVREPVDYLDVVFNGETIYSAKLEEHYKRGEFPPIEIDKSGWLVIRIVTEHSKGYRFATTAPFYFEFDSKSRVSRKAVSFFQQWHKAAVEQITKSPSLIQRYEPWINLSEQFWDDRLRESNAE